MGSPTPAQLTDEHLRILAAIQEERLSVNGNGRYVIEGEARPDRKSREQLRARGLIAHHYEQGRGSHWRVTAKGRAALGRRDEWRGVYPGMCIDPETCRGKTACPRNYSCCE